MDDELILEAELNQELLSLGELERWAGVRSELLLEYLAYGLIEPGRSIGAPAFPVETVPRVRKIRRLETQLGINLQGIAIVLQLLEEVEMLRREQQASSR